MRQERRRHPRLEIPLETELRLAGSEKSASVTMEDLSAGGAGLLTTFEIPIGTELESLRFELPGGRDAEPHPVELAARVARCERQEGVGGEAEYLIGVQFVDISRELFDRIQQFVFRGLRGSQSDRVQIERPIAIRFDRFDDFVDEVSVNLSKSGMFIRTRDPRPPGSVFNFQFQLGEDFSLIEGRAEVVWRRRHAEGDKLPGMGVKFVNLDVPSQQLIDRLIAQKAEAEAAGSATPEAEAPEPMAPRPEAAAEPPATEPAASAGGDEIELAPPPDPGPTAAAFADSGQLAELRAAADELRQQLETARLDHRQELQDLRARLEDRQAAATSELEERLRDAETAHQELRRRHAEVAQELDASRQEAERLRGEIAAALPPTEGERLSAERDELLAARDALRGEVEHIRREADELERTRETQREELEQLRGKAAELERSRAEADELRAEVERIRGQAAELKTVNDDLQARLDAAEQEAVTLREQLAALPSAEEVGQLASARRSLEATTERLLADLDRAHGETDEMRRQLDDRRRDEGELRAELEEARSGLEAARGELEDLRRTHRAALGQIEADHAAALEAAGAAVREEAAGEAEGLRRELAAARERGEALESELETLRRELEEAAAQDEERERLRSQLAVTEEARRTAEAAARQVRDEARQAAGRAEEREMALRADAENAALAAAGVAPPARRPRRRSRAAAVAALLLVGAVLGTLAVTFLEPLGTLTARLRPGGREAGPVAASRPAPAASAPATESATPAAAAPAEPPPVEPAAPSTGAAPPAEPEPEPAAAAPDPATAEQAVLAWAAAWSDQRVDDYLDAYADSFEPPDGQSRAAWAATRRQRIERPDSIEVGIEAARTVELGADRVSVSFDQAYASDTYSDRVRKTLVLVWQDDGWKIAEERVIE